MVAAYQSYNQNAAGSGAAAVVTKPTGTTTGDFLVAIGITSGTTITISAGTGAAWVQPSWSLGGQVPIWCKEANSTEPANYTFTPVGGILPFTGGMVIRFNGHKPGAPFDTGSGHSVFGNIVLPTITPSGAGRLLAQIVLKASVANTWTPPGTATERFDAVLNNLSSALGDEVVGASATGTRTWTPTDTGAGAVGYMLAIAPASQNLAVTGFAPAVAFGTATLRRTVATTGLAPAVAFGTPSVILDQQLPVSGFAPNVVFGTPAIVQEVNPSGFTPTVDFGTPTVTIDQFVTPSGFAPSVDFGAPSLGQFVNVDGFTVPVLFGTAVPILDNVLAVTGFSVPISFGGVTLQAQTVVTGTVFNHETGDPVGAGVTVKLFDDNDVLVDTTTTDGASTFTFYRPFGDTDTYWTLATYDVLGVQYHGVSDRGCPAV